MYLRLKENKLLSVYDPEILIFHEGSATSKKNNKDKRKSNIFVFKNRIKANNVLIKELKEYNKQLSRKEHEE